jgi:hypothetical protein
MARLGFDPTVSPQFYVFEFVDEAEVLTVSRVNIYSSESARWTHHRSGWDQHVHLEITSRSAFVSGRLYMVTKLSELVAVDTEGETWTLFHDFSVEFIGLSERHLHCVTARSYANVRVLCLEQYDSDVWICKLHITKEQLYENRGVVWNIVGIHPDCDNLFLATADDTQLGSYHMQQRKFHHILDLDEEAQGQYLPYVPTYSDKLQGILQYVLLLLVCYRKWFYQIT